jgi:hypothetical protein
VEAIHGIGQICGGKITRNTVFVSLPDLGSLVEQPEAKGTTQRGIGYKQLKGISGDELIRIGYTRLTEEHQFINRSDWRSRWIWWQRSQPVLDSPHAEPKPLSNQVELVAVKGLTR